MSWSLFLLLTAWIRVLPDGGGSVLCWGVGVMTAFLIILTISILCALIASHDDA